MHSEFTVIPFLNQSASLKPRSNRPHIARSCYHDPCLDDRHAESSTFLMQPELVYDWVIYMQYGPSGGDKQRLGCIQCPNPRLCHTRLDQFICVGNTISHSCTSCGQLTTQGSWVSLFDGPTVVPLSMLVSTISLLETIRQIRKSSQCKPIYIHQRMSSCGCSRALPLQDDPCSHPTGPLQSDCSGWRLTAEFSPGKCPPLIDSRL